MRMTWLNQGARDWTDLTAQAEYVRKETGQERLQLSQECSSGLRTAAKIPGSRHISVWPASDTCAQELLLQLGLLLTVRSDAWVENGCLCTGCKGADPDIHVGYL